MYRPGERRYWAESVDIEHGRVWLDAQEAHHALRVMRLRPGDSIEVIDGSGRLFAVEIESLEGQGGGARGGSQSRGTQRLATRLLRVSEPEEVAPLPWLAQALIRPARLEELIDGATQLGLGGIILFASARTTAPFHLTSERRERLGRLMRVATTQSLGLRLPELQGPVPFAALAAALRGFRMWVAHGPAASGAHRPAAADAAPSAPRAAHALVVGPEGGLTDAEVGSLIDGGASLLDLGPRRLRSETAAIAGLALLSDSIRSS